LYSDPSRIAGICRTWLVFQLTVREEIAAGWVRTARRSAPAA